MAADDLFNDRFGENLRQQIVNISKAGAYDIVSKQVQELQAENKALKETLLKIDAICYRQKHWVEMDKIAEIIKAALTPVQDTGAFAE